MKTIRWKTVTEDEIEFLRRYFRSGLTAEVIDGPTPCIDNTFVYTLHLADADGAVLLVDVPEAVLEKIFQH